MRRAFAIAFASGALLPLPAAAEDDAADPRQTVIVVGDRHPRPADQLPGTTASLSADRIAATVNATNIEDTVKYLPSLLVRKRHIGDTQSPLATRTSGVGASARSLIYADGALLSALIGNNNGLASPRWGLVTPQEVERIDVLYGPYSAAYPGNAIGAVVNITTRLPDKLEASGTLGTSLQPFSQYGTRRTLPSYSAGATIGDRFGPLALFASASHVTSSSQPLAYITAARPGATGSGGTPTSGGFDDLNRGGAPIRVIGAGGFEHQRQDFYKLKAALDITSAIRVTYVGGLFLDHTGATAETYLTSNGAPAYTGSFNIAGYAYPLVAASAFANNVYRHDERHWSHSLSAIGTEGRFDWQVIGTLYDFAHDEQRGPTGALPAAADGGGGNITRLEGTGWSTFDTKAGWRGGDHMISAGYHHDRFTLASNRYATSDWLTGSEGALNLASRGRTQTDALWLQDAWHFAAPLTLTLGARQEWWRASDGYNFSLLPAAAIVQPSRTASALSPKASLAWVPAPAWKATLSFGRAYRFPTVAELYQAVTTGPTITSPNPDLRPERATSAELAIEHRGIRLSLFSESIDDALVSQSRLLPNTTTPVNFVQNVDRTRARGIEVAFDRRNILPGFDLSASATWVEPLIRADAAFPAAIGKDLPQVPRRRATIVATWRPAQPVSLTAALRHASRSYATIDNSDPVANTYQGFAGYTVVDLRATFAVTPHWQMAVGADNVGGARYFLFHPFPQRSFSAELRWRY
jgi:iron complex outermembrane receptor protein